MASRTSAQLLIQNTPCFLRTTLGNNHIGNPNDVSLSRSIIYVVMALLGWFTRKPQTVTFLAADSNMAPSILGFFFIADFVTMVQSSGSSSSGEEEMGLEEEDEEGVEGLEDHSIGAFSFNDLLLPAGDDFLDSFDMFFSDTGTGEENQERHSEAVEFFTEPNASEGQEDITGGPEVQWLANHIITSRPESQQTVGQVRIEEIIQRILTHFIPYLRQQGFTGATAEELIGSYNATLRGGPRPLIPSTRGSSSRDPAPTGKSSSATKKKWKIKNRPTYAQGLKKYKKRTGEKMKTARKTKKKAPDVRISRCPVF